MQLPHRGKRIALDHGDGDISFISHAHGDHINGIKRQTNFIASSETLSLAGLGCGQELPDGAKLIDAGHILGARQLVLEEDGKKTVYTGDISLKQNIFGMGAESIECDRLIMESTYAKPEYKFPDTFEVYEKMANWIKQNNEANILIGAYELGKAQEIIKLLNEYCGIAPIVTEKTESFCEVYERFGIKLDRAVVGSESAEEAMRRRFIAIVPMARAKKSFASKLEKAFEKKTLLAIATGWALKYRYNADAAFALSDHADFNDLVFYAGQSNAKEIEFFEGDGSRVVEAVSRLANKMEMKTCI